MAEVRQFEQPAVRRHHALGLGVLALGLALGALAVALTENWDLYALVAVLFVLCFGPLWVSWRHGRLDFFEPIHLTGLLSFVSFGLGAIWTMNNPGVAYDTHIIPYIPEAVLYCVLGYAGLLGGYYLPWSSGARRVRFELVPTGTVFLAIPAVLGFGAYVAARFSFISKRLGFGLEPVVHSMAQLAPLFLLAWTLGWMLLLSRRATRNQKLLLLLFMVPAAFYIARSFMGSKTVVVTLLGLPIAAYWYTRRRLPWKVIVALLLVLVFVIFPFYNTFRLYDIRLAYTERMSLTMNRIGDWDSNEYMRWSVGTFQKRMALINSVAVVVRDVGRWVPYAKGETLFEPFLVSFIPRFLWPAKPMQQSGYEFGSTFRVLSVSDRETNIAATIPGELYWNFSVPGVVIGMFLWGWFLRLVYRRFGESPTLDPVRRSIYLSVVVGLVFVGSIAPGLVGIVRTLLVIFGLCWVSQHFGLLKRVPVADPVRPA